MKKACYKLEELLNKGGIKKDTVLLAVSAVCIILSFFGLTPDVFDIAWIAVVLCGLPIVLGAFIGLITKFDIKADVLVSMALIASICIGEIFAAGEVAVIMMTGSLLEELTVSRTRAGIEKLVDLTPQTARVITDDAEHIVLAEEVAIGDTIRVLPGETVPVDGVIISGVASIDQAVMTGESVPVDKAEGDEVLSGTINLCGAFEMKATKACADSQIARISMMLPGLGVSALVHGKNILAGNLKLLEENGIYPEDTSFAYEYLSKGATLIYLAVDGRFSGFIALSDTLKEGSADMISALKKNDITCVLLTGDNENAASFVADRLGIEEVKSGCLPEDKLKFLGEYEQNIGNVCMIGDGINDAPALKKATVGIAMGGAGSDIATDSANIALINDNIKELPHIMALSRRMMKTIKLNMAFSLTLNFVAIILAISGTLSPTVGALIHNAGSVAVIINSTLLLRWRQQK